MQVENMAKTSRSTSQTNPTYVATLLPKAGFAEHSADGYLAEFKASSSGTFPGTAVTPLKCRRQRAAPLRQRYRNPHFEGLSHLGLKSLVFCRLENMEHLVMLMK